MKNSVHEDSLLPNLETIEGSGMNIFPGPGVQIN